jgi:hypothetical protein
MPMYIVTISQGEKKGSEIFRSENFSYASTAADNYKRDTNMNCSVESRTTVYTTQTLDEALKTAQKDARRFIMVVGDHSPEARRERAEWAADTLRQGR